jgi:hypothetical protein
MSCFIGSPSVDEWKIIPIVKGVNKKVGFKIHPVYGHNHKMGFGRVGYCLSMLKKQRLTKRKKGLKRKAPAERIQPGPQAAVINNIDRCLSNPSQSVMQRKGAA